MTSAGVLKMAPPYIIAQYLLNTAKTTIRIRISSVNDIFD